MNTRKDSTPFRPHKAGGGIGIKSLGAWIAGLALAALVVSPPALYGAAIDNFDGDQPAWNGWNAPTAPSDPAALAHLASHRLRIATKFTTPTDPANPMDHSCDVYYDTDLPVQPGKTLQLRADLVSVGVGNTLFASLATTDVNGGKYMLLWGRTEVALLKWSQGAGFSVAFWETHATAYHDLILALALTPEGDDLVVKGTARSRNGTMIYHRTVRDTPGSDWGVPDPLPLGWQIFGPDPGPAYTGDVKLVALGVLHDTDGQQGTAFVQFDNLEARAFAPPTQTFVIDDFEHGRKFMPWGVGSQPECEFVGGEFNLFLPPGTWTSFFYNLDGVCEMAEEEPIELRLDAISASASDVWVELSVFCEVGGGYGFYVLRDRVLLIKDSGGVFFDLTVPANASPKTICLTLNPEGDSMRIGTKVVLRDDPSHVLFYRETIDHPGVDLMVGGQDPGPAPRGPVVQVLFNCGCISGSGCQVVLDNLVCSTDQSPVRVAIQRKNATEATLTWPTVQVAVESDSLQGPWHPCPEPVCYEAGEKVVAIGLSGSSRYFRTVRGWFQLDTFDQRPSNTYDRMWHTASAVPGTSRPQFIYETTHSRGHIRGTGVNNEDFMLRWNLGILYLDCVATVDILDWGDAMEDAAFGILLRAKPDTLLWYCTTAGLPDQRYAGLLTFKKADNPAESALSITGPGGELLKEQRFAAANPDKQYRLRFWAVGDQLTLELFDKENLDAPIQTINATDGRVGEGMDGLYGTKSAGGTYQVWIDQYVLNGTTQY